MNNRALTNRAFKLSISSEEKDSEALYNLKASGAVRVDKGYSLLVSDPSLRLNLRR